MFYIYQQKCTTCFCMPHMNLQKMECCVFLYALHKSTKNILYLYELSLCPTCVPKDTHMIFMSYINQRKSWHVLKTYWYPTFICFRMFYINLRKTWHIFINFCMSYMYLRKCTCFCMSYINQRKSWHFHVPHLHKEIYYMFLYILHKSTTIMACPQKLLHVPEEI